VDTTLGELIGGALRLDRNTFAAIETAPNGLRASLTVLLLAGASETLGQAVVLILNRVSRLRFLLALFLGGLQLVVEALVWIASIWVAAGLFVPERASFVSATRVIGLAYAPLVLGVLVFLPYIGPMLARLLRLWVLLAAIVGISVVFDLSPLLAAATAAIGFFNRALLLWLCSGLSAAGSQWLWRAQTGQATPLHSTDALLPLGPPEPRR
jgi:hypothetical protein